MDLSDFIIETGLKTFFSPFTTAAKIIDNVLDTPEEDRWDTFVNSRPGVDLQNLTNNLKL